MQLSDVIMPTFGVAMYETIADKHTHEKTTSLLKKGDFYFENPMMRTKMNLSAYADLAGQLSPQLASTTLNAPSRLY